MTLAELRTLARYWLDDDDGGYFTDAMMLVFLNNAQRELQKKLLKAGEDYYAICVESSTVKDQRDYQFPSDFFQLHRMERITQGSGDTASTERLYKITRNEVDVGDYNTQASSQGMPFNYVINKNTFSLYPVPNEGGVVLRLWYSPRVENMVDDADVPDAPEDYHEFIAIMAARDGFLRDGRSLTPIESKLAYYEEMLDQTAEDRTDDSPRMVVATPEGFGAL